MPVIMEIFLERIRVVENGRMEDEGGVNALAATLHYPRENVPAVTAVRPLGTGLADNGTLALSRLPLHRRLLFKEVVRGTCMLEVTLSMATQASKLEKFLHRVFGTAFTTGVGAVTAGLGALPAAVLSQASVTLFEMAQPEDEITLIGLGHFPIAEDMAHQRIPMQLTLPQPLVIQKVELRDGQRVLVERTYPAGFGNAEVTIRVNKLPFD